MSYERMSSGRFIVYDDAVGYSGVLTIRRQPGASSSRKSVSSAVHGLHPCFVDHMISSEYSGSVRHYIGVLCNNAALVTGSILRDTAAKK